MSYGYNELAISNSLHGGNKLNESGMDSEVDKVSGTSSGIETEAAKASPDSTEPLIQRRGSRRLVKTAVTSPSSGDFRSVSGATVRVLRARRAGASRTNESKNAPCKKKTTSLLRSRRSTGSRSKNTPHKQPAIKKSAAKKASKHALGRKLSTSRKGKGTLPTRASRTPPSTTCKAEAEMKNSSFVEETGALKGSSDNIADPDTAPDEDDPNDLIYEPQTKRDKSRRRTTLQKQDVKKEESEKEEEENNIKREESAEVVVQMDEGDNTEPPRKRGRQQNDDKAPGPSKRRKKPPVQYVRCEMEGCGTVLAHPRYLQHHIKYQHLLQKKYVCDHPSCGRLFRLQKQLLRHTKHHTDQRDYICEYCARAFKSSHNLAVHRMIHTGEKPIQCEICGFTCRQKASLNWHMKKHDAEASYQFSCSICGKKFEKKDSVVAHKAKSHPEVLIAEALAANGGSVISTPAISISETASVLTQPDQPSVSPVSNETQDSLDSQEAVSGTLAPLQQVVLPLTSHTQVDVSQGQFLHLPMHHMVQLAHPQQQQAPTMLNLTTATPAHMSSSSLLTLSSVTAQAVHWGRGAHVDPELSGEGQLWDRWVVGAGGGGRGHQEVEEMMWEREGERQILLHCAEVHGDSLI